MTNEELVSKLQDPRSSIYWTDNWNSYALRALGVLEPKTKRGTNRCIRFRFNRTPWNSFVGWIEFRAGESVFYIFSNDFKERPYYKEAFESTFKGYDLDLSKYRSVWGDEYKFSCHPADTIKTMKALYDFIESVKRMGHKSELEI